jgi:hypothetical protein
LLAAPAPAQSLPADAFLSAADPAGLASYLKQVGLKAELSTDGDGEPGIETGLGGIPVKIWFYDCKPRGEDCTSVQLQTGLETTTKLTLDQVNGFNRQYRFATLALDESNDPILSQDVAMPRPGLSPAAFRATLAVFETQIGRLKALVGIESPPPSAKQGLGGGAEATGADGL